jgi:hypothetical protein
MRGLLILCFAVFVIPIQAKEGELSIPLVSPLEPMQLEKLRDFVKTHPEARSLAAVVTKEALPLLDTKPNPVPEIHYEGLVNTDPRRIACVQNLHDMAKASRLMKYWQVSGDERAAETLKNYILAWVKTYQLTGNDVNENKLYPLLVAYHAIRDSFSKDDRPFIDQWVEKLGTLHWRAVKTSTHLTNRYAKHLRLLAIAGRILDRENWLAASYEGIQRFVSNSLYEDGSSLDFKRRDTLTYHASSLKPPIELAILAGSKGKSLYTWSSEEGGSIEKSVNFVVPYALGEKTRQEWTHSQVELDHRRAEAGLEYYRQGRLYEPQNALELMELASFFDPELMKVVHHLTGNKVTRFPTWQTLINEVARVD